NLLDQRREICFRGVLFVAAEQLPLAVLDPVKQMQAMPAFFGNQRRVLISHRASFGSAPFGSSNGIDDVDARWRRELASTSRGKQIYGTQKALSWLITSVSNR